MGQEAEGTKPWCPELMAGTLWEEVTEKLVMAERAGTGTFRDVVGTSATLSALLPWEQAHCVSMTRWASPWDSLVSAGVASAMAEQQEGSAWISML